MDRSELLAELRGHGNHLNVTRSENPGEVAKGIGLILLALEQLLAEEEPREESLGRATGLQVELPPQRALKADPVSADPQLRYSRIQPQQPANTSLNMARSWGGPR